VWSVVAMSTDRRLSGIVAPRCDVTPSTLSTGEQRQPDPESAAERAQSAAGVRILATDDDALPVVTVGCVSDPPQRSLSHHVRPPAPIHLNTIHKHVINDQKQLLNPQPDLMTRQHGQLPIGLHVFHLKHRIFADSHRLIMMCIFIQYS